jgi:hypothetical protein
MVINVILWWQIYTGYRPSLDIKKQGNLPHFFKCYKLANWYKIKTQNITKYGRTPKLTSQVAILIWHAHYSSDLPLFIFCFFWVWYFFLCTYMFVCDYNNFNSNVLNTMLKFELELEWMAWVEDKPECILKRGISREENLRKWIWIWN